MSLAAAGKPLSVGEKHLHLMRALKQRDGPQCKRCVAAGRRPVIGLLSTKESHAETERKEKPLLFALSAAEPAGEEMSLQTYKPLNWTLKVCPTCPKAEQTHSHYFIETEQLNPPGLKLGG